MTTQEATNIDPELRTALTDMKVIINTIERGGALTTYYKLILDTVRWIDSLSHYIEGACGELADLDGNSDDLD
jgi:hypothetical protein